ncbi:MAG: hypothetical protein H6827_09740 [Planctomycetes bacterium]|nr:hypothetical protein [Planctomycetota bacterium]
MRTAVDALEIPDAEIVRLLEAGEDATLHGCRLFGAKPGEADLAWATNAYGMDYCANSFPELVQYTRRNAGRCGLIPSEG